MFDEVRYERLKAETHPTIKQFIHLIESHCHELRGITFYANKINVSEQKLTYLIIQNFNVSPVDILRLFLIKEILDKLATTDLRLKELTYTFGFKSQSNFTKFIRTYTGLTPSRYRALKYV
jgi:hydroxymethylpyrimidine/phosphomethylpyrimidine kinase